MRFRWCPRSPPHTSRIAHNTFSPWRRGCRPSQWRSAEGRAAAEMLQRAEPCGGWCGAEDGAMHRAVPRTRGLPSVLSSKVFSSVPSSARGSSRRTTSSLKNDYRRFCPGGGSSPSISWSATLLGALMVISDQPGPILRRCSLVTVTTSRSCPSQGYWTPMNR